MLKFNNLFLSVLIVGVTIACGSVSNPDAAVNDLETNKEISEIQVGSIATVLAKYPNGTQLAIAMIQDSTVAFYGAVRQKDTLHTINNADRVFEIGSLSKVFTSTLLADFAIDGIIRLEDPIQQYLDFPLKDSLQITFKHLSNHTSGMPRVPSGFIWEVLWHMDNPYKDYNEEKLRQYLSEEVELQTEPGADHQYSNIGSGTLGYVLTKVAGKSYEELLQERIFRPLEMKHSTTQKSSVKDRLVTGLNKRGNTASNWDLAALEGAGAILSTSEDLAKFAVANFDTANEVFHLQQQETFTVSDSMNIALGWFTLYRDSGDRWHWHNGGTGGYRSTMFLDVNDRKGVLILSNISEGHSHASEIDALAKLLLQSMQTQPVAAE